MRWRCLQLKKRWPDAGIAELLLQEAMPHRVWLPRIVLIVPLATLLAGLSALHAYHLADKETAMATAVNMHAMTPRAPRPSVPDPRGLLFMRQVSHHASGAVASASTALTGFAKQLRPVTIDFQPLASLGATLKSFHVRPTAERTAAATKKKGRKKKDDEMQVVIVDSPATSAKKRGRKKKENGMQLVIVESPAKAKTINQYLGSDFLVIASVGHIRDLKSKAPKGSKQPVPGVDLENDFEPSYEILPGKGKTVTDLKKAAEDASEIWFATDLDREGEAIAWHLATILGVEHAKRVIFNAITKSEIQRAFENPLSIDEYKVNAQQARRILDRIVGFQASPLLWKKVSFGLSAGRVQSVATRLIVEREREIDAFVPDELWDVGVKLALDPAAAPGLVDAWADFIAEPDESGRPRSIKQQNAWLADNAGLRTDLVELHGQKFELGCTKTAVEDLSSRVTAVAEDVGLAEVSIKTVEDPKGKGAARFLRTVSGRVMPGVRYTVDSIETTRKSSKPSAPFITSSLQMSASSLFGFTADRTMRIAQQLYMGLEVSGEGQIGLITYMRTDSTRLSDDAVSAVRGYIGDQFGDAYLPEKPRRYGSSNKNAQEAHEAIRPTDPSRTPFQVMSSLNDEQFKLYKLIWSRFVACQMIDALWNSTTVRFSRADQNTGAVLKTTGRILTFDGWTRVDGVTASDEQVLPAVSIGDELAPFAIEPRQRFSSPPARYNEGSLIKKLEDEGVGRPSTYASIIKVIQDRNYAEKVGKAFHATDIGEVATDKMIKAFPSLMDIGYTRELEKRLDAIEEEHMEWKSMLRDFYSSFNTSLALAYDQLEHAKGEIQPARYACPTCGSITCYRFGRKGRFLSCSTYPSCNYSAPIDRAGCPILPEMVDIRSPQDGSQMILRTGPFGKFLASPNYPDSDFVLGLDNKGHLKFPKPPAVETTLKCSKCETRTFRLRSGKRGPWLGCAGFPKCRGRGSFATLEDKVRKKLEKQLKKQLELHPTPVITTMNGTEIEEGASISDFLMPVLNQDLAIHPDATE
eukprot:gnl/TRDRNA2_/TRDRNA2_88239_c0_seq1.p1 gnl/TRDRNA2_/TRDRNA2_88239_c0~~gnl/TRDRNA2_/TRDRNA2_88239_c0_seq1.p1  ORF type:complete len:1035 (+),score=173.06 gnl/TRDRNA2_/TRDRNA2_88239_c0_seq1:37-3141(+)